MTTITEFLLERIAEDERQASNVLVFRMNPRTRMPGNQAIPARVLAECAAKRAIIAHINLGTPRAMTETEQHTYAMHPAWEYATTEGQRKAWNDADVPPEGEGWERNVDRGRNGWDRLDYTEESYWRRPRAGGPRKTPVNPILRALAAVYADHPDYQRDWA